MCRIIIHKTCGYQPNMFIAMLPKLHKFYFRGYEGDFVGAFGIKTFKNIDVVFITTQYVYTFSLNKRTVEIIENEPSPYDPAYVAGYRKKKVISIKRINSDRTWILAETEDGTVYKHTIYLDPCYSSLEDKTNFIRFMNPDVQIDWENGNYYIQCNKKYKIIRWLTYAADFNSHTVYPNSTNRS